MGSELPPSQSTVVSTYYSRVPSLPFGASWSPGTLRCINPTVFNLLVVHYLRPCRCSTVVALVALRIGELLEREGIPYCEEMAAAVAIYSSKRHCDRWITLGLSPGNPERRVVTDIEWIVLDLEVAGLIDVSQLYGVRLYRCLGLEVYDTTVEIVVIRYIARYGLLPPTPHVLSEMVINYALCRRELDRSSEGEVLA